MKKSIFVDETQRELVITKAFYKRACVFGSEEYYVLRQAKSENEGFDVVFQFQKRGKKTYDGLSFKRMRAYIETQPNSAERLIEFDAVHDVAKAKGASYALIKEWFFQTFPNYKLDEVKNDEAKNGIVDMMAAAKKLAEEKKNTSSNTQLSNAESLGIGA